MSYANSVGSYLIPNNPLASTSLADSPLSEVDIGASSGDHGEMICIRSCKVKRLLFVVSGEAVSGTTTAPTVIFTKRPTPLSATDESAIGTLTIPTGTAIGKVVYKDLDAIALAVGDSVEISWTVGVGTPTGMGFWGLEVDEDPEEPANNSDMIESA